MAEDETEKVEEAQETASQEQEIEETETSEGSTNLGTASTHLKCPHTAECIRPRKKIKALKLAIDPITLTEGDLHDICETVHDVTNKALQDFMQEHQTVLGALIVQL